MMMVYGAGDKGEGGGRHPMRKGVEPHETEHLNKRVMTEEEPAVLSLPLSAATEISS